MRVAVIAGGLSDEASVSRRSAETITATLRELDHEPVRVDVTDTGWHCENERLTFSPGGGLANCDVAIALASGVKGFLETLGVPYTGSRASTVALTQHKRVTKDILRAWQLPQVDYVQWDERAGVEQIARLGWPVFVKPARLGSSIGISKVDEAAQLTEAIAQASAHDPIVLVEQAAIGDELEVAVLGSVDPIASVVGQVQIGDKGWNDYDNKYADGPARLDVPAPIDARVAKQARELAIDAYRVLGCTGGARVDLFHDPSTGEVLINEVNSNPMLTATSALPLLWAASGMELTAVVDSLLTDALRCHEIARATRI